MTMTQKYIVIQSNILMRFLLFTQHSYNLHKTKIIFFADLLNLPLSFHASGI